MSRSLYICYFGVREPLVQTQVIPYLKEILKDGTEIILLTFEADFKDKWTKEAIDSQKKKLAEEGIIWTCLPYHKRFSVLATLYDVLFGAWNVRKIIKHKKVDILHARIHVPALMGIIARKTSFFHKPKLLFDIRGFFPEEYVDAGTWKENGWIYKSVKRVEKWILKESNGFVVLTEKAREIMFPESKESGDDRFGRPVEVIPCCVNYKVFEENEENTRENVRNQLGLNGRFVVAYTGSLGGLYQTDKIADFFTAVREKNKETFAMILTQSNQDLILPLLTEGGFTEKDFLIKKISPQEIPNYLNGADLALSFVKSGYATLSRSPTKIPEYLACGLPVVANSGVGDVEELIKEDKVGTIIEDFRKDSYFNALQEIEKIIAENDNLRTICKLSAKKRFDLALEGGTKYRRLYKKLLS